MTLHSTFHTQLAANTKPPTSFAAWLKASGLALTAVFAITATVAQAQVIVVQSSAKNLRAGSQLQNSAAVNIPAGKSVLFVLPSGATRTVSGPFKGKAGDLTKGVKANPSVLAAVKRYVRTGGTHQKRVGAMRSAAPSFSFGKPLPFSWHMVPVAASGDICIEKGAAIKLARQRTSREQAITVIDMKSQRRVQVLFAKGQQSQPWPDDLDLDPRATYSVILPGRSPRQLRMRLISPLPSRENILQVLHGQRCETQFRTFIREMQNTG